MNFKEEKSKGITLIALVITIIVLLILAGVTIATLTGDNGLLSKAQEAKDRSETAKMGDRIQTAMLAAQTNKDGELTKDGLETELKKEFKTEDVEVIEIGENFIIRIDDKFFNTNGELLEAKEIEYAGDLSKGGKYDGLTEDTAFRINCIEDLVEWTNKFTTYENNFIKLERTLDFENPSSYSNFLKSDVDLNGDGKKEYIIVELTTGTGFKPIAYFSGTFDGQGNEIQNIYENRATGSAGLIAGEINKTSAIIKNLGVTGNIETTLQGNMQGVGGIVGYGAKEINNCYNKCNIIQNGTSSSYRAAGGVIGDGGTNVINCINYGTISSKGMAGGIVGFGVGIINNCYNLGDVTGDEYAGGVFGGNHGDASSYYIYNSYNSGAVKSTNYSGGIVGYDWFNNPYVLNCFNVGNIKSTGNNKVAGICYFTKELIGDRLNRAYYLDNAEYAVVNQKYVGNKKSSEYLKSQEFVNELNTYVDNYTPVEGQEDIQLTKWKYNENDYPSFVD